MSQDSHADDGTEAEQGLFPVDPKWFKIGFYVFLLLWLVYILQESVTYTDFEDVFFPYVVGIPVLIMVLLQLLIIRYPGIVDRVLPESATTTSDGDDELQRRLDEATKATGRPKRERERYELVMMAWIIVLPFLMFYLGMGWTLVVYIFTFTWYFVRDLKTATLVTILVFAFVYVLFIYILDMILWTGELGFPDPLDFVDNLL